MIPGRYVRATTEQTTTLTITEIGHNSYSINYDSVVCVDNGIREQGRWQFTTSLQRESMFHSNGFYRLQHNIYPDRILVHESGRNLALGPNIRLGGTYVREAVMVA